MEKKRNNKGFTLAELLIVVAIIAVLVAIAIPIFTNQLEKSKEATDVANIRDYYAEISTALVGDELDYGKVNESINVSGGKTVDLGFSFEITKINGNESAEITFTKL